jgi:hypothetical protein
MRACPAGDPATVNVRCPSGRLRREALGHEHHLGGAVAGHTLSFFRYAVTEGTNLKYALGRRNPVHLHLTDHCEVWPSERSITAR